MSSVPSATRSGVYAEIVGRARSTLGGVNSIEFLAQEGNQTLSSTFLFVAAEQTGLDHVTTSHVEIESVAKGVGDTAIVDYTVTTRVAAGDASADAETMQTNMEDDAGFSSALTAAFNAAAIAPDFTDVTTTIVVDIDHGISTSPSVSPTVSPSAMPTADVDEEDTTSSTDNTGIIFGAVAGGTAALLAAAFVMMRVPKNLDLKESVDTNTEAPVMEMQHVKKNEPKAEDLIADMTAGGVLSDTDVEEREGPTAAELEEIRVKKLKKDKKRMKALKKKIKELKDKGDDKTKDEAKKYKKLKKEYSKLKERLEDAAAPPPDTPLEESTL